MTTYKFLEGYKL